MTCPCAFHGKSVTSTLFYKHVTTYIYISVYYHL